MRLRLLAGAVVWIVLSVLLAGWSLAQMFRQHATTQFHNELTLHLNQLTAAFALDEDGQAGLTADLSDPRLAQPLSGLFWQIDRLDDQGRTTQSAVLRSRSLWDQTLPAPPEAARHAPDDYFYPGTLPDVALHVLARTLHLDTEAEAGEETETRWRLSIAADQQLLQAPIARFTHMLVIALGLLALGMSVAALGLVLGGLRPLALLRRRLMDVADGRSPQINGAFPAEIQPLVNEFNTVLAINTEIVQRARSQAGNLAHAVKTPLTILDNAARVNGKFDKKPNENPDDALRQLIIEQVQLARQQIDYHLARARVAATAQASGMRTPLATVLPALARTMRRLYAERSLDISIPALPERPDETGDLAFKGEAQDLHEMLGNLLDNACKWARGRVVVTVDVQKTGQDKRQLILHVDDDGAGLPDQEIQAAFHRGVRLDEQRPGSGLGLSIAAEMAGLYQGSIHASASPLGGLRMTLVLPTC